MALCDVCLPFSCHSISSSAHVPVTDCSILLRSAVLCVCVCVCVFEAAAFAVLYECHSGLLYPQPALGLTIASLHPHGCMESVCEQGRFPAYTAL